MSVRELTDEQTDAVVRRSEPLLLSAAAGSGKTSVLVERFVAAVREDGLAPAQVLAITFTERAAGELRARVRARLLELGEREAARDTEAAFIGTFHGFCARLLRTHALAAGLDPGFAILDEPSAARLRERAFAEALRAFVAGEREEAIELLAAYGVDRVRHMLEQVHAELRSRGQRLPRLPSPRAEGEDARAARACALLAELLRGFSGAYERLKRDRLSPAGRAPTVDFDDLELLALELLNGRPELRDAWSQRFELLMVDEFQDTNPRQLAILTALDRGNLFTVGDELQSIYGFRHADVSLFRRRRADLERVGASLRLTRNFRSREALLAVVNAVFAERFDDYVPLRAGRSRRVAPEEAAAPAGRSSPVAPEEVAPPVGAPEEVAPEEIAPPAGTSDGDAGEPEVELLLTDVRGWEEGGELASRVAAGLPRAQAWRQAEARLLAQRIADLVSDGRARPGDVVVLVRAVGDLEVFERALQLCGLRTLAAVGAFWAHQQIADLVAYVRALANPLDELALHSALASPLGGCSLDCLALLADAARTHGRSLWATALAAEELGLGLSEADARALTEFCAWLAQERADSPRRGLGQLIERALARSGYREHVLGLEWAERRLANVHKLLRLARRFEVSEGRDLRAFLDHVEHLQSIGRAEPDAPVAPALDGDGVEPDAVRLMTVHAAKGLEFPIVCVADLGRQPNTQTPDLLVDGRRVGLRLVGLEGAKSTPALEYEALSRERREREAEEEDRILYVAMTRARERLILSGALDLSRWPAAGARQAAPAICWLGPALSGELPALAGATPEPVRDLEVGADGEVRVRCRLSRPDTVGQVLRLPPAQECPPAREHQPARKPVPAQERPSVQERPAAPGEQLSLVLEDSSVGQPPAVAEGPTRRSATPAARVSASGPTAPVAGIEARPEAPSDALPATLSYTSLAELERCGYRYYLERVLGLPEEREAARRAQGADRQALEPRARGTLIHRLLERGEFARSFASPPPGSPLDADEVELRARELGLRVAAAEREEIARLVTVACAAEPAARVAAARQVWREHPFAFPAGPSQPLVSGVIDLLALESDGTYLILDYKSDRVSADEDLAELVEREYAIQRELYALALLRGPAERVEVLHWFLERPHEPVGARFAASERGTLQERLLARLAAAAAQPFRVSPQPHRALCLTCPGRGGLCSWSEAETLGEIPVRAA